MTRNGGYGLYRGIILNSADVTYVLGKPVTGGADRGGREICLRARD